MKQPVYRRFLANVELLVAPELPAGRTSPR